MISQSGRARICRRAAIPRRHVPNEDDVNQDHVGAVLWFRKAAEQGLVVAQCDLGAMNASGVGLKQDYVEALRWSLKSAEQGFAGAQEPMQRAKEELRKQRQAASPSSVGTPLSSALSYANCQSLPL